MGTLAAATGLLHASNAGHSGDLLFISGCAAGGIRRPQGGGLDLGLMEAAGDLWGQGTYLQETSGDRGLTTISEGLGGVLTNNAGWPLFDGKYVAYS